jgi:GNAT superfamily N-acetyltransferase
MGEDAGRIAIDFEPPDGRDGSALLAAYFADNRERFGEFDPERSEPASVDDMSPPGGWFGVLRVDGRALACGGFKRLDARTAEIKRMYVAPDGRGRGLGRTMLARLEAVAAEMGYERVRLDTGAVHHEATALYRRAGYREIPDYNGNPYAALWFEKRLG